MIDPITQMAIMSGWMRKQRGEPEVAQPGPTMAAWKARIPQDIDGVWPSQPRAMSEEEVLDMVANVATPVAGTIRKAALTPAELSVRGILEMADDRLASLGKSQFAKLRNAAPTFSQDVSEQLEPGMLYKARNRLFEEAERRAKRDAQLRMADQLAPNQFVESAPSAADMARSNGPRSGAWARKYR